MLDALAVMLDHRLADLEPRDFLDAERAMEIVWNRHWSKELRLHILIEDLFMVVAGIRLSSFHHPSSESEIAHLNAAARELGLGMRVRLAGRKIYKIWLSGPRNFGMIETLPDITENMGRREFITAQIALAKMTGKFLGYPECCTSSFVGHLLAGTDQDLESMEALKKVKDPDPRAYFVERFVPCSPECPEAIGEGERIERELRDRAPNLLPEYLRLREEHMDEVRSGAIIREKEARDSSAVNRR